MPKGRQIFPIKMHPEMKEKLREVARKKNVSMAHIVYAALNDYFKKNL